MGGIIMLLNMVFLTLTITPVFALEEENTPIVPYNWGQINAKIYEAQQITTGSNDVIVGVLDTGIQSPSFAE